MFANELCLQVLLDNNKFRKNIVFSNCRCLSRHIILYSIVLYFIWYYTLVIVSLLLTRVQRSPPFNAKLCKISGECGKFCKISGECRKITKIRL